jgi:adenylate cyclase
MGVFGVPFPDPHDALHAVTASLKMLVGLKDLNKRNSVLKLPELQLGIGICTGMALSGNIGSPKRMEYTVIGDSVGLASKIEALTATYGCSILICDRTYGMVRDHFHIREIDTIRSKDKGETTAIYEVIDFIYVALPNEFMVSNTFSIVVTELIFCCVRRLH